MNCACYVFNKLSQVRHIKIVQHSNNIRRSSQNSVKHLHENKTPDDPYFGSGLPASLHLSLMMSPGHDILVSASLLN